MKKDTIRLIIWGLLFAVTFAFGVIGLVASKSTQKVNQYNYNYQE